MKIGLALGGGVARGFFHIGAIRALEKSKIKIDLISGTSIGSLIGGLYALNADINKVEEHVIEILERHQKEVALMKSSFSATNVEAKTDFLENFFDMAKEFYIWNLRIAKPSLVTIKPFIKIFKGLFGDCLFSDCKIPFLVTAVDICKGEVVIINEGQLYKGVLASSSYPGFFPPVRTEGRLLIDGGVLMPVPVKILKQKTDFVIAINLERSDYKSPHIRNAMDLMNLADRIRYRRIIEESLVGADFLIAPDLEDFCWGDFSRAKELAKKGEHETIKVVKNLEKAIKQHKVRKFFFLDRFFSRA
ncbi:MAG: patatin-like phospholipase family protein, partial [Candidatus Omnitrophota bacterium]